MIWFTADLHLGHTNIIKYCKRPFSSSKEMDEAILANINGCVMKNDYLYILGDFSLTRGQKSDYIKKCFNSINCQNKILIKGNHDSEEILNLAWKEVYQYYELHASGKTPIVMFHYPLLEWNGYYRNSIHIHGHQHNLNFSNSDERRFDVGVDAWNFCPVSINLLEQIALTKKNISE